MTSAAPPAAFILMSWLVLGPACGDGTARNGAQVDGALPAFSSRTGKPLPPAADTHGPMTPGDASRNERDSSAGLPDSAADGEPRDATAVEPATYSRFG